MPTNVFLSVGRTFTPEQERFVSEFEQYLRANGLTPQTVGRTYIKNQQPLRSVAECMRECSGAAVLAFERTHVASGVEKRGSAQAVALAEVNLPTVWNQIEAAMAYSLGRPLLVLVEHGIRSEGLLETGYDWYVKWVDLRQPTFSDPEFTALFADWKAKVAAPIGGAAPSGSAAEEADVGKMSVGQLLGRLKAGQLWSVVSALFAAIVGALALGYRVGLWSAARS